MAAAAVESSIQRNISSSPLKMTSTQSVSGSPEAPHAAPNQSATEPHHQRESSETSQPEHDSPEKTSKKNEQTAAASSAEALRTDKSSQETTDDTQPDGASQESETQARGGGGADSDSDDEPVSRSRPRARRLALDSDEEEVDSPAGVTGGDAAAAVEEEPDSDGAERMDVSPAPARGRGRVRRLALDSDDEDEQGEARGASGNAEKGAAPAAGTGSEGEDSEAEEKKRKERNLKRLMALGDSSSEDERPRTQSPTMDVEDEEQPEATKSGGKKKQPKKKVERQKVEQEAANQMRQIRSAAQRRTRESRLNLPYHRPRQRTLHEFLARRQKAPALPDHPRVSAADADTITRRLEETEKEIEEFYRSESEHEDGPGSDPEWAPETAPAPATKPQSPGGPTTAAAATATAAAAATTTATAATAPGVGEAKEDEEEEKMMSQSSQKVQDWLEGVQPAGDDAVILPMTDLGEAEPPALGTEPAAAAGEAKTATKAETAVETVVVAEPAVEETETGTGEKRESEEAAPAAVDELRPAEEARSVSADTETTSLAPGDSASEVNTRAAAAAAPAPAPPAARLARLAARLPQLGAAVLNSTPRLQKRSEVVSLDDSDDEEAPPEQSDMDKFVARFKRHSNAKPKKAEKKTVNISLVRYETDEAGEKQLVSDSVPVTLTSGDTSEPCDGPPGAGRQQLHKTLMSSIRKQREEARQRREREYKLYNNEEVEDGYLDDLPDEEAEPSDVSSESGESEPEEEPPLTETPRKRCPGLVDDEAEQEDDEGVEDGNGEEKEDGDGEGDEFNLVLEDDEEDLLDSPRRASVATEPELFSTQPSGGHGHAGSASQVDSQDSDQASSSLVTAHQPGGGFRFGGNRRDAEDEVKTAAEDGHDDLPLTLDTQPTCGTGSFSFPPEDTQQLMARFSAAGGTENIPDSISQLGPLRLTPEPHAVVACGPRSAIGALLDPAADDCMDDLMSLCSGKFDAPGTVKSGRMTRADTQPVDLLSMPLPTNKDGVMTWSAASASQKRGQRNPSSDAPRGMSLMSTVDMFEDGNANMPLDIVSDDDDEASNTQLVKQKKRRRRLVFSDDEGSDNEEPADQDSANEEEDVEDSGEDSVQAGRAEDASLPTDFTGFLGRDDRDKKKRMRSEFLDAEAELSGSDEPSEDEADGDELDRMDEEEADAEQIDEAKLREQVERIHQKTALDDDIREMKMFQERFLEGGDLHGKGRERKFRWSNADAGDDDSNERRPSDDEEDPVEEERDEKWRLERHEREKWLQENAQKEQDGEEPETSGFTFLKPGQKVLRRLVSGGLRSSEGAAPAPAPAVVRSATLPPPLPGSPRAVKVSRGSFLRRGKEALARLVTTARSLSVPGATSSKNSNTRTFSVTKRQQTESEPDPEVELQFQKTVEEKTTKRKAPSTPATDPKRAKLSRSFSSLAEGSQSSSLFSVIL